MMNSSKTSQKCTTKPRALEICPQCGHEFVGRPIETLEAFCILNGHQFRNAREDDVLARRCERCGVFEDEPPTEKRHANP